MSKKKRKLRLGCHTIIAAICFPFNVYENVFSKHGEWFYKAFRGLTKPDEYAIDKFEEAFALWGVFETMTDAGGLDDSLFFYGRKKYDRI